MKRKANMKKILLWLVIPVPLIFGLHCSGPMVTKPNTSALYRVPSLKGKLPPLPSAEKIKSAKPLAEELQSLFRQLYALDPHIAIEVGKLPEFQDEIKRKDIKALNKLVKLLGTATPYEKDNLKALMSEGKPDVRRYCTPLQALIWLLEEDEVYLKPNPLGYPLEDILLYAWVFWEKNRWGNFGQVTDRLNSPELINYYEKANFSYVRCQDAHICDLITASGPDPRYIFRHKKGSCSFFTSFSVYCLRKAGYEAEPLMVLWNPDKHVVCEFVERGKKYILDNTCRTCPTGDMAGGHGIIEKSIYIESMPVIGVGYRWR